MSRGTNDIAVVALLANGLSSVTEDGQASGVSESLKLVGQGLSALVVARRALAAVR